MRYVPVTDQLLIKIGRKIWNTPGNKLPRPPNIAYVVPMICVLFQNTTFVIIGYVAMPFFLKNIYFNIFISLNFFYNFMYWNF